MSDAWLMERIPGYAALPDPDRNAIRSFAFLWSLFEAKLMGRQASARRIAQAVKEWDDAGTLGAELYDGEVAYFRERYFRDGKFTSLFYGLRTRKGDMPALIAAGISGDAEAPRERVLTVLLVIWRLRNNLFHGEKWAYGLQGQFANFTHANAVLMRVLERHADLH